MDGARSSSGCGSDGSDLPSTTCSVGPKDPAVGNGTPTAHAESVGAASAVTTALPRHMLALETPAAASGQAKASPRPTPAKPKRTSRKSTSSSASSSASCPQCCSAAFDPTAAVAGDMPVPVPLATPASQEQQGPGAAATPAPDESASKRFRWEERPVIMSPPLASLPAPPTFPLPCPTFAAALESPKPNAEFVPAAVATPRSPPPRFLSTQDEEAALKELAAILNGCSSSTVASGVCGAAFSSNPTNLGSDSCELELHRTWGVDGIPESVARCPGDVTLVTDVLNHRVHRFEGTEYRGLWAPSVHFHAPRSVLAVARPEAVPSVYLLDQRALFRFDERGILLQRGCDGPTGAQHYRGLAAVDGKRALLTVETTVASGVRIVVLDADLDGGILKQIPLSPALSPQDLSLSKIRNLTTSDDLAYLSDLQLGCVFIVRLEDSAAEGAAGSYKKVKLDKPMGIDRDSQGNLLVASLASSSLEVFDPRGYFLRSVKLRNCGNPCDVVLASADGADGVFVTDFKNKLVQQYKIAKKNR